MSQLVGQSPEEGSRFPLRHASHVTLCRAGPLSGISCRAPGPGSVSASCTYTYLDNPVVSRNKNTGWQTCGYRSMQDFRQRGMLRANLLKCSQLRKNVALACRFASVCKPNRKRSRNLPLSELPGSRILLGHNSRFCHTIPTFGCKNLFGLFLCFGCITENPGINHM